VTPFDFDGMRFFVVVLLDWLVDPSLHTAKPALPPEVEEANLKARAIKESVHTLSSALFFKEAFRGGIDYEGLLSTAMHSSDVGFSLADEEAGDLPIVWVSKGFERMTGYVSAAFVGVNCRQLQTEASDPSTIAAMRAAIDAVTPIRVCVWNAGKDQVGFWNCLSMHPFKIAEKSRYFVASQVRLSHANHKKLIRLARHSMTKPGYGSQRYAAMGSNVCTSPAGSRHGAPGKGDEPGLPMVGETPSTIDLSSSSPRAAGSTADSEAASSPSGSAASAKSSTCVLL